MLRRERQKATNPQTKRLLRVLEEERYARRDGTLIPFRDDLRRSVEGSRTYQSDALGALLEQSGPGGSPAKISVIDVTTQVAAQGLAPDVILLNFASAKKPGGGFLGKARAQEEDLCRCSGLYLSLREQMTDFYQPHRKEADPAYSDRIIYSPRVPFLRTSANDRWLDDYFCASVLTAPAPNRRYVDLGTDTRAIFGRRWRNLLAVAETHGYRKVVFGAWGCGVFGNDAFEVAATAKEALEDPRFGGSFDEVVFAIPTFGPERNLRAFREVFESP